MRQRGRDIGGQPDCARDRLLHPRLIYPIWDAACRCSNSCPSSWRTSTPPASSRSPAGVLWRSRRAVNEMVRQSGHRLRRCPPLGQRSGPGVLRRYQKAVHWTTCWNQGEIIGHEGYPIFLVTRQTTTRSLSRSLPTSSHRVQRTRPSTSASRPLTAPEYFGARRRRQVTPRPDLTSGSCVDDCGAGERAMRSASASVSRATWQPNRRELSDDEFIQWELGFREDVIDASAPRAPKSNFMRDAFNMGFYRERSCSAR